MASLLDPFGLIPRAVGTVRFGLNVASRAAGVLNQLAQGATSPQAPRELTAGPSAGHTDEHAAPRTLSDKMDELQRRALEHSTTSSRTELFHRILDQIVPDEARILSALSDGSVSPLVHVRALTATGGAGPTLLQNASLVGRTANLALAGLTPVYVGHLLSLGLVEVGPEDPALKDEYQILTADSDVLKAIKAGSRGMLPARVDKHTLRLSALGRALWQATGGAS